MTNLDSILKSRDITLPTKVHLVKDMVFPVVMMWELDYKESWALKNWCFWTVCWRRLLRVPWMAKRRSVLVFIGRTDVEAETPILWPPDAKHWFIWKDPDARKDWGQKEKETTEDEMAGWHHRFNRHRFEWTLGVSDGQGGLSCCSPWGWKEFDKTEQLNWLISFKGKKNELLWLDDLFLHCSYDHKWLFHSTVYNYLISSRTKKTLKNMILSF